MRYARGLATFLPVLAFACYAEEAPPPVAPPPVAAVEPAPPPLVAVAPVPAAAPVAARSPGLAAHTITFQAPTAEPLAPPPISRPPAMVALPNLPHPSKYPHLPAAPNTKDVTGCGAIWNGVEWVEAECVDEPMPGGGGGRAAKVVVPYALMKPTAVAMPDLVDHRADGMEGPIRKQVGTQCTAFAFTAALDHAYSRWTGTPGNFSVMEVWARYHATSETRAIEGNIGDSIAGEADWPYDGTTAKSWTFCPKPPKVAPPGTCGQPVDPRLVANAESMAVAEITQIEVIPENQLDVVREKLAAGQDVVVGIRLHSFATGGTPGAKYLIADEANKPSKGKHGHQILLVGYAKTPNGYYYLVHNSHGTNWGDDGYAWMHEDVLRAYQVGSDMVVPEIQPREIASRRLRADGSLSAKCAAGMAQDSISGACAPKCADGSPRRNNVCAAPKSDCFAGAVNLTGTCVLAAPTSSGIDPSTQIRWSCGPGGCAYDVPQGSLNCRDAMCGASCPAPAFRLATSPTGLACVE